MLVQRIIAFTLAFCLANISQASSLKSVFDAINATSNVSSPAALTGQTMNVYSGGSAFVRMPSRTYNLIQFTPPSYAAGCGGIDLYMGGFSHINKAQFVAMLKNIGQNAVGYGFKLALQNLCPTCDNVIQALQQTANMMNRLNIDSCEAAKGVVNAAFTDANTKGVQQSAMDLGTFTNYFSDTTEAWTNVKNSYTESARTIQTATDANPTLKDSAPMGNIVWKALNKQGHLGSSPDDMKYKMILMSLVGTVIFDPVNSQTPRFVTGTDITVSTLLGANNAGNTIQINYLDCGGDTSPDGCLNPVERQETIQSFSGMINAKMTAIVDKIANRQAHTNVPDLVAFLSATDIPVYKLLSVTTSLNNPSMADLMISRYRELIAARYAMVYIERAVKDLRAGIAHYRANAPAGMGDVTEETDKRIDRLLTESRAAMTTAYASAQTTYRVVEEIQHIERAMNSQLSQTLKQSLAFSRTSR